MVSAAQLSLIGHEAPGVDVSLGGLERSWLDDGAWFDRCHGWVRGHETIFDSLRASTRWHAGRRVMYERVVDVPRLTAGIPDDGPGHLILSAIAVALSARYGVVFDRTGLALYRDGHDSVAWHRDKVLCEQPQALVAIVSLGAPRKFQLRPHGGGPARSMSFGWGDLVVMGGTCQRDWEHGVPKSRHVSGPRMAVMFRHSEVLQGPPMLRS